MLHMPHHIALCCFYRLVVVVRLLWEREMAHEKASIKTQIFYDGSIDYFNIERVGGLAPFLLKTFRADLVRVLGEDHKLFSQKPAPLTGQLLFDSESDSDAFNPADLFRDGPGTGMIVPIMARLLSQQHGLMGGSLFVDRYHLPSRALDKRHTKLGEISSPDSLLELLDGLVMFYHSSVHTEISKLRELHADIDKYSTALDDCKQRIDATRKLHDSSGNKSRERSVLNESEHTREVFEKELSEQARNFAWLRASDLTEEKQNNLMWLLRTTLDAVKKSAAEGTLFSFLPDFYLESMVEICLTLRSYFPPTMPLENVEGHEELLIEISQFLCDYFADPRIIQANSKDTMIHALASFVCTPNTLHALEKVPKSR